MIPVALIFIALHVYAASGRECFSYEEKIYHFADPDETTALNWMQALAECGKNGMTLASIKNRQEFDAFMHGFTTNSNGQKYWIGATCVGGCKAGDRKVWYWISDRSKLYKVNEVANNWYNGNDRLEPTLRDEKDVVLSVAKTTWQSDSFLSTMLWVCQECRPKHYRAMKKLD